MSWNPRYLAYCAATGGLSPDDTLARDRQRYPGGCMAGFIIWSSQQAERWRALTGRQFLDADYDAWLAEQHQLEVAA